MKRLNEEKAAVLYRYLDQSKLFHGLARKDSRSLMNVTFRTDSAELDAALHEYAEVKSQAAGLDPVELYEARQAIRLGQ